MAGYFRAIVLLLLLPSMGAFAQSRSVYTPQKGSVERTAIMDAARLAQQGAVRFQVNYLAAFRQGKDAIAVADLQDADEQMPYGGLMFFEQIGGRWRAL